MKTKFVSRKVIAAGIACVLLMLACKVFTGTTPAEPVSQPTDVEQVPAPTDTPRSINLPEPTNPPRPTATEKILATPTPAPVGEAVRSESFEVTVVNARELNRVYMGDFYYYPKAGQMFVEFIVKVSNLTGSKASVPWENVYVIEDTGDAWYPNWGGFKDVKTGKTVDGSTIGVNEIVDGKATLDFEEDVFLRLIWFLTKKDKTTILFGFDDSPLIEFTVK